PPPRPTGGPRSIADRDHPSAADAPVAQPDRLPPDPRRPPRRRAASSARPAGRPRPAGAARPPGLDRAGPAGDRPVRQAPGRRRPRRAVARPPRPGLTELGQARALLDQAEAKLDALAKDDAAVQLLETIPGVGPRTAEAVAAYLPDPKRFDTGKQVSAYAGLVPRQYQSGEVDHRGRITKRGPALLRRLLVECAWVMLRYNAWARA